MKRRTPDVLTLDLFDAPPAALSEPGSLDLNSKIALAMGDAIRNCPHDRLEVCTRMSRLTGHEVTGSMLDAYTSTAREAHNISLARAVAFDAATEGYALLNLFARARGCSVLVGQDALLAELGRVEQERQALSAREKLIKRALGGGK